MVNKKYSRKIYLEDKPRNEAKEQLLANFSPEREAEVLKCSNTLGRVTAQPIFATISMPHYHASAMDGIAVKAESTFSAHEQNPIHLKRHVDFEYVDTGNAIPSQFDAVIMIENVVEIDEDTLEIIEPAAPWQHIRPIGEDVVQGEMLFPQGHRIRPADIGALLAAQISEIPVYKKPLVTIIPTGNELVTHETNLSSGQIIEFNGTVMASFINEWGGQAHLTEIVRDNPESIKEALLNAVETSDIVVINAGSSAGSKDYTVHIISELGEVFTHGVATRPGKPVILGKINDTIVVGVPGYPVSAYLSLEWFVRPLVCEYLQVAEPKRERLQVKLGRRIVSSMGSEDFVRMNVGYVNGNYIANPLPRAAGVTMSYVRADGILVVPAEKLGYEQGDYVDVELLKPLEKITSSIVFNGSHDLTIDLLSSHLKLKNHQMEVISSHVGSMAGIMAIRKGEAHVAGIHLLDPETKEYNISYVQRFLAGQEVVLVPFLRRTQGWFLPKGNPLRIKDISDLVEKKAHFVNRQRGAGTRVLFDMMLKEAGIEADQISGYEREMFSHLSVAAEVKSDEKAVGLGIYPAAQTMNLDFIPVADESYDLLMTKSFYESTKGQLLLSVMHSPKFAKEVEKIGGYAVVKDRDPLIFS